MYLKVMDVRINCTSFTRATTNTASRVSRTAEDMVTEIATCWYPVRPPPPPPPPPSLLVEKSSIGVKRGARVDVL